MDQIVVSGCCSGQSTYACMYVIFTRCDKRTSNNKHKKQSQNDVQYKAAKPKKTISLDKDDADV